MLARENGIVSEGMRENVSVNELARERKVALAQAREKARISERMVC